MQWQVKMDGSTLSALEARKKMSRPLPIELPQPRTDSGTSLEQALRQRRCTRSFAAAQLTLAQAAQLLWSAQGITGREGLRSAPSAGALYPLELYLVAASVKDLPAGVYHYRPDEHRLAAHGDTDMHIALAHAALDQPAVMEAAAVVVFTSVHERTMRKYGQRGIQYAHIEVGHAAENLFLQAVALGLHTVVVGAFEDDAASNALELPDNQVPLLLMPVGR
jgi:SagB-type dehydrogenase family enzyme